MDREERSQNIDNTILQDAKQPTFPRPVRKAKKVFNEAQHQEIFSRTQLIDRRRTLLESSKQHRQRLKDMRRRARERIAAETDEQKNRRLEDLRQRAKLRLAQETAEERNQRLQDMRLRAMQRRIKKMEQQKKQSLDCQTNCEDNDTEALSARIAVCRDSIETLMREVKSGICGSEPLSAPKIRRGDEYYANNLCSTDNFYIKSEPNENEFPADVNVAIGNEDKTLLTSEFIIKDEYDVTNKAEFVSSNETLLEPKSSRSILKYKVCNEQFPFKPVLESYWSVDVKMKHFECNLCHKQFQRKPNLRRHMELHSEEKQFKCYLCKKQFRAKRYLRRHMLIHPGETKLKCDLCLKQFRLKKNFQKHMLMHLERKPFECYRCKEMFEQNSDLQEHVVMHLEEK